MYNFYISPFNCKKKIRIAYVENIKKLKETMEILKKAGCRADGQKVFFETALVEELRTLPPAEFTLYGRCAETNVVFDQNALVMIPCYGSPFVLDLDKGRREGVREDFVNFFTFCVGIQLYCIQKFFLIVL